MLHHKHDELELLSQWEKRDNIARQEPQLVYLSNEHWYICVCSFYDTSDKRRGEWVVDITNRRSNPWEKRQWTYTSCPDRPDLLAIIDRCFCGDNPIPPGIFMDMFLESL